MARRDRPDKIKKNGRTYIPIDRNGYFAKNYMYKLLRNGAYVNDVHYKIDSCTIPAYGERVFRYVCLSDLEAVAKAFEELPVNQTTWVYRYIMENASMFRSHHKTSAWLKRHIKTKFGLTIANSVVQDAARLARNRDEKILVGERPVKLVYRLLKKDPSLRYEDGMMRKVMALAEREFGLKVNSRLVTAAAKMFDEKHGSIPSLVDKEKWATTKEAAEFLGIGIKSMRSLGREGLVERAYLLKRYLWFSWESLRAYKEKRDARGVKLEERFRGKKSLTEQESMIE